MEVNSIQSERWRSTIVKKRRLPDYKEDKQKLSKEVVRKDSGEVGVCQCEKQITHYLTLLRVEYSIVEYSHKTKYLANIFVYFHSRFSINLYRNNTNFY